MRNIKKVFVRVEGTKPEWHEAVVVSQIARGFTAQLVRFEMEVFRLWRDEDTTWKVAPNTGHLPGPE